MALYGGAVRSAWLLALAIAPVLAGQASAQVGNRHRRTALQDTSQVPPSAETSDGKGITLEPFYTGEVISNLRGGVRPGSSLHGVADLILTVDPGTLFGWSGPTLGAALVGIHGDHPDTLTGDYQGVSNIAAPRALRLYELWLRQRLFNDRLSVLLGIYDINSLFDVLETAALFLNSSSGMGPGFSCSGRDGAPTYPRPGLSLMVEALLSERIGLLAMVADGVPGDPDDPQGTSYRIGSDEGALLCGELSWAAGWEGLERYPSVAPRWHARRRRFGLFSSDPGTRRGRGTRGRRRVPATLEAPAPAAAGPATLRYGKFAVGFWRYTSTFTIPADGGGGLINRRGSWGGYLLAERSLSLDRNDPRKTVGGFLRIGMADGRVEEIDRYAGLGIVSSGTIGESGFHEMGAAVTAARLSWTYADLIGAGEESGRWEVAFELTWRVQITDSFALQPDIQYVIHPGFDTSLRDALVLGLRLDLAP